MALNCQQTTPKERPCGTCESCELVQRGSHPDVIELDAASNNSVEDVRDLREKVTLAPLRGESRVWILDEAHMLSRAASNALLKTLEEPPPRLVFILATTEPEKLPATILSRCQHFRFRRLTDAEIRSKLEALCQQANIEASTPALDLVARVADGAMRDAESLLERLLTSGKSITIESTEEALGLPPQERLRRLAEVLVAGELDTLFDLANRFYQQGYAPRSIAEQLALTLRDALVNQVSETGDSFTLALDATALQRLIHALDDDQERFTRRDDLFSLEVTLIKALNTLTGNLPHGPTTDVALAEWNSPASPETVIQPPAANVTANEIDQAPVTNSVADRPTKLSWHAVKSQANPQLKAFLMPAQESIQDQQVTLRYGDTHKFHFAELKKRHDELVELIQKVAGQSYSLLIEGPGEALRKKS
jgi:DNA polymerase-3 subunit gamma/tau